jgi:hypothetical protein
MCRAVNELKLSFATCFFLLTMRVYDFCRILASRLRVVFVIEYICCGCDATLATLKKVGSDGNK